MWLLSFVARRATPPPDIQLEVPNNGTPITVQGAGTRRRYPVRADCGIGPTVESGRLLSLDILRGVAVLGMLAMNISAFSMPAAAYSDPTAYGDLNGANW